MGPSIAENFSNIMETFNLLPNNHFGGCPGCSTTDMIHYLTNKILHTWRTNKVASVLFLDVKGAFPNAVTMHLLHNLKKKKNPTFYSQFCRTTPQKQKNQTQI